MSHAKELLSVQGHIITDVFVICVSNVSGAHQPHHGPLSRGGLVFTQPSNGTLLLPDDVIVSPPTERTNQELLSNIPLCPELSASKEQTIQQPVPYFYSEKKLFLVSLLA